MMSAKYFEYYTIILRGAVFSWTHCTSLCFCMAWCLWHYISFLLHKQWLQLTKFNPSSDNNFPAFLHPCPSQIGHASHCILYYCFLHDYSHHQLPQPSHYMAYIPSSEYVMPKAVPFLIWLFRSDLVISYQLHYGRQANDNSNLFHSAFLHQQHCRPISLQQLYLCMS